MKKTVFIAAILVFSLLLAGCDMIDELKVNGNAGLGEKVEDESMPTREGALIEAISSSETSLTVKIDNNTDSTWQSGNMRDYRLETERDGEWYEVKQIGEFANTMELMIFAPGKTLTHTFEFAERYGKLSEGNYRVVKSFWANATESTEAHEFYLVCEFTV